MSEREITESVMPPATVWPTTPVKRYVVGFMFSQDMSRVALIRKQKPAWQAGKLNGIGGKIEPGETAVAAMSREFNEEAGYLGAQELWRHFLCMFGKENDDGGRFSVDFFARLGPIDFLKSREVEKIELVHVYRIHPLRQDLIDNLAWAIGLAIDALQDGRPAFVTCEYP